LSVAFRLLQLPLWLREFVAAAVVARAVTTSQIGGWMGPFPPIVLVIVAVRAVMPGVPRANYCPLQLHV